MLLKLELIWETFLDLFFPRAKLKSVLSENILKQIRETPALDLSHQYANLDSLIVASDYALIKPLLIRFKYHFEKYLAQDLGQILYQKLSQKIDLGELILPDLITFAPGDKKRVGARGFNSPELLAKYLSQKFKLPLKSLFLKPKSTIAQAKLNRLERLNNLEKSFVLDIPDKLEMSKIKQIWLIDDVIATGTTVKNLTALVKLQYPQIQITTVVLARTEDW